MRKLPRLIAASKLTSGSPKQRPATLLLTYNGTLNWIQSTQLFQGGISIHDGQGIQITVIDLLADFGCAVEVGDSVAQTVPLLRFVRFSLRPTEDI
jgi:hypothetical protein